MQIFVQRLILNGFYNMRRKISKKKGRARDARLTQAGEHKADELSYMQLMNGYYSISTLQFKPSGFFEYLLYQNFMIQSVNIEGLQDVSKTKGER